MMDSKNIDTSVKDRRLVQKRREQMIKAGVKLFTDKGFHRTTTREIAREAGFSIGTLYEYIRSKEDVLYLVCDDIYTRVKQGLEKQIDFSGDPWSALRQAIQNYIYVIDELQDEVLVMYQETKSLSKEALPYVLNKEREMAVIFENILKRCVDSGVLHINQEWRAFHAQQILVQCQMWTFRRWAVQTQFTLEQFTTKQVHSLLQSIKPA